MPFKVAGTIGTGLFLGSGSALSGAGPAGALIAYIVVGSVAYSALCCIGEKEGEGGGGCADEAEAEDDDGGHTL